VLEIIGILRNIPAATISPANIGESSPATSGDLPAIAVSVPSAIESPAGIGGIIGWSLAGGQWTQITSTRTTGMLKVDIWASAPGDLPPLTNAVFQVLDTTSSLMRGSGFVVFSAGSIQAIESLALTDGSEASRLSVLFSIVHEQTVSDVTGPGGTIQQIEADIDGQFNEKMILKA
jgi:hypothetical protein